MSETRRKLLACGYRTIEVGDHGSLYGVFRLDDEGDFFSVSRDLAPGPTDRRYVVMRRELIRELHFPGCRAYVGRLIETGAAL